jgi:hypothetical protein
MLDSDVFIVDRFGRRRVAKKGGVMADGDRLVFPVTLMDAQLRDVLAEKYRGGGAVRVVDAPACLLVTGPASCSTATMRLPIRLRRLHIASGYSSSMSSPASAASLMMMKRMTTILVAGRNPRASGGSGWRARRRARPWVQTRGN